MTIKLLCIDPNGNDDLIDKALLKASNIDLILMSKTSITNHNVLVNSLDYADMYTACQCIKPDYIVCLSEELFAPVAKIRSLLGIKGMDLAKANLLCHKNLMYEQLHGYLPYPKTTKITESSSLSILMSDLNSGEIFIKPINGSGSCETYHIKNNMDYQGFLSNRALRLDNYIAQSYINAELYHSELVVFKGEILFSSARKYSLPNHLMVSCNEPLFSLNITDKAIQKKIIDASIQVQKRLNINNAILHTEFFLSDQGELNFIETNARPPGIGLNRMYQKKLSVSLETLICFIVSGVTPPAIIEQSDYYVCGYYPLKQGIVKTIDIPALEVANQWISYVKPNDSFKQAKRMTKSAMVICWDPCEKKIEETRLSLSKHKLIEVY